jgi:hypothetical protein
MTGEKRVKMLGGSDGERKLHDTWSTAKFVVADVALMTGTLYGRSVGCGLWTRVVLRLRRCAHAIATDDSELVYIYTYTHFTTLQSFLTLNKPFKACIPDLI